MIIILLNWIFKKKLVQITKRESAYQIQKLRAAICIANQIENTNIISSVEILVKCRHYSTLWPKGLQKLVFFIFFKRHNITILKAQLLIYDWRSSLPQSERLLLFSTKPTKPGKPFYHNTFLFYIRQYRS